MPDIACHLQCNHLVKRYVVSRPGLRKILLGHLLAKDMSITVQTRPLKGLTRSFEDTIIWAREAKEQ
jgi:hypothetical protein